MGFWFDTKTNSPPTAGAPSLSLATFSFTLHEKRRTAVSLGEAEHRGSGSGDAAQWRKGAGPTAGREKLLIPD